MIEDLIKLATNGDPGSARDAARELSDPALLPQFHALFRGKLTTVERKLAYEFLENLARNSKSPEVATFLLGRLGAEKNEATQRAILASLRLLDGLDCTPIEPFLASPKPPIRLAAIQALGACAGERPVRLLMDILRRSEGGEEMRVCAEAPARQGNESAADTVIGALVGLARSRDNALAVIYLLLAASVLCTPHHRAWLRDQLKVRNDAVERWLVLLGLTRIGTKDDCTEVAAEVAAYLEKPMGPINLMTGFVPVAHRSAFQAGMSFLHRICPDRFAELAEEALRSKLPPEDRSFLASFS